MPLFLWWYHWNSSFSLVIIGGVIFLALRKYVIEMVECKFQTSIFSQGSPLMCGTESMVYSYISDPPNLMENDHNFMCFWLAIIKVSIQQHFKSCLLWKAKTKCQKAENSRITSEPWFLPTHYETWSLWPIHAVDKIAWTSTWLGQNCWLL